MDDDLGPIPPMPAIPGAPRYDWEAVRQTFVEGHLDGQGAIQWLNLRETAELHGVPYPRIRNHAATHNWTEARGLFQQQMAQVRRAERAQMASVKIQELDNQSVAAAEAGLALVTERLTQILHNVANASQSDDMDVYVEPLDARELATLARAAADWRELGAMALGYPTGRTVLEVADAQEGPIPVDLREKLSFDDTDDSRLLGTIAALEAAGFFHDGRTETGDPAVSYPALPSG